MANTKGQGSRLLRLVLQALRPGSGDLEKDYPEIAELSRWLHPVVLSRHRTHQILNQLSLQFPCVVNLGMQHARQMPRGNYTVVNLPVGCRNSADKRIMKGCFTSQGVPTAPWWHSYHQVTDNDFPIVAKHRMGSRGTGVYLLRNGTELASMRNFRGQEFFDNTFVLEAYRPYAHEYRIHATQTEAFYANRKALRNSTPESRRWKYTYEDSIWLREDNPGFYKPKNWGAICDAARWAVAAVGLDVGACDIKVEPKPGSPADFFIIEVNSAPSFGDLTASRYMEIMPAIAKGIHAKRQPYDPDKDTFSPNQ